MNKDKEAIRKLEEALSLCPIVMDVCKNETSDAILIRDGIVQALALLAEPGCKQPEAGEFTKDIRELYIKRLLREPTIDEKEIIGWLKRACDKIDHQATERVDKQPEKANKPVLCACVECQEVREAKIKQLKFASARDRNLAELAKGNCEQLQAEVRRLKEVNRKTHEEWEIAATIHEEKYLQAEQLQDKLKAAEERIEVLEKLLQVLHNFLGRLEATGHAEYAMELEAEIEQALSGKAGE